MIDPLDEVKAKIRNQIKLLRKAEGDYRTLDAATDHLLNSLIEKAEGSSHAAKEMKAKASDEWLKHKTALGIAKTEFSYETHKLDYFVEELNALKLTLKLDQLCISKDIE